MNLTSSRFIPGPGAYDPKNSINSSGKYILSNMQSTLSPSFSLPSIKGRNSALDNTTAIKNPGPGAYD